MNSSLLVPRRAVLGIRRGWATAAGVCYHLLQGRNVLLNDEVRRVS